jgi:hypothetical protein
VTLVKEVFTDVLSCDKLVATLMKDAFTMLLVDVKEVFSCDKLVATFVKDVFTDVLS